MSEKQIRVVFVVTGLPVGGAELVLYRLLSNLPSWVKPHVVSLRQIDHVGRRIEELGITVDCLGMNQGRLNPFAVVRLARKLKELRPDVVQTWMYHADLLGGIAARLAVPDCPVVWNVRHNNLSPSNTKVATICVAKLCAWLSRKIPARIVFNSESSRNRHVQFGYSESRSMVIPNGLDFTGFGSAPTDRTEIRQTLRIPPNAPLVGMIARFDIVKNHAGFMRIAAKLTEQMPECHFLFAGLGVDRDNPLFDEWVRTTTLGERIHLLGLRTDVPRLMAAIDVLAMPSWAEAFPNVVVEALACGTPCVVADVGDAPYILGDAGKVVPPGNDEEFSRGLEELLRLAPAERRAVGERGRARVQELFTLEQMTNRYIALYEACIGSPR